MALMCFVDSLINWSASEFFLVWSDCKKSCYKYLHKFCMNMSFSIFSGSGITWLYSNYMLSLIRNHPTVFQSGCVTCHCLRQFTSFQLLCVLVCGHCQVSSTLAVLIGVQCYLICISSWLMMLSLFSCTSLSYISSFQVLVQIFCPF